MRLRLVAEVRLHSGTCRSRECAQVPSLDSSPASLLLSAPPPTSDGLSAAHKMSLASHRGRHSTAAQHVSSLVVCETCRARGERDDFAGGSHSRLYVITYCLRPATQRSCVLKLTCHGTGGSTSHTFESGSQAGGRPGEPDPVRLTDGNPHADAHATRSETMTGRSETRTGSQTRSQSVTPPSPVTWSISVSWRRRGGGGESPLAGRAGASA